MDAKPSFYLFWCKITFMKEKQPVIIGTLISIEAIHIMDKMVTHNILNLTEN